MPIRVKVVDQAACTGCSQCLLMCSFIQTKKAFNPKRAFLKIDMNLKEGGNGVSVCRQCSKALCLEVCEEGALEYKDGVLRVLEEKCTFCGDCIDACKWDGIWENPVTGKAVKCDLCGGKEPACVSICRRGVFEIRGVKNAV